MNINELKAEYFTAQKEQETARREFTTKPFDVERLAKYNNANKKLAEKRKAYIQAKAEKYSENLKAAIEKAFNDFERQVGLK